MMYVPHIWVPTFVCSRTLECGRVCAAEPWVCVLSREHLRFKLATTRNTEYERGDLHNTISVGEIHVSNKAGKLGDKKRRFKANYEREGTRTRVEAIILVHQHRISHVLLLRLTNSSFYGLPGGRLRVGGDEMQGLKRKLDRYFTPSESSYRWQVGECVAKWRRP